jgi:hypothetical protein
VTVKFSTLQAWPSTLSVSADERSTHASPRPSGAFDDIPLITKVAENVFIDSKRVLCPRTHRHARHHGPARHDMKFGHRAFLLGTPVFIVF